MGPVIKSEHGHGCSNGWIEPLPTGQHAISKNMRKRAAEIKAELEESKESKKSKKDRKPMVEVKKEKDVKEDGVVNEQLDSISEELDEIKEELAEIKTEVKEEMSLHTEIKDEPNTEIKAEPNTEKKDEPNTEKKDEPKTKKVEVKRRVTSKSKPVASIFDIHTAVKAIGEPPQREWTNKRAYSWGYHKFKAMFQKSLSPEDLKQESAAVGRAVAALLCAHEACP